jgi:archaellum component FlaC
MMIVRHEELADLLETFDIEALEEQSKDINALHEQLNAIKEVSQKIIQDLQETSDSVSTANKVVSGLDIIFSKIASIIL